MSLTQRIARDSLSITLFVMLGRSVGMLAPLFIARWFGANAATDAYFLVLGVPLFAVSLLQTAILSALNPIVARLRLEGPQTLAPFLGATILTAVAALTVFAAFLGVAVPPLLHLLARGRPELAEAAVTMFHLLLPIVPITGAGLVLRSVLEVEAAFRAAALVPLFKGVATLVFMGLLRQPAGLMALPLSYVAAELCQLLGYVIAVKALGVRVTWRLQVPAALREAIARILPLILGEAAVNLNVVIDKAFAARLGAGELSALEYADRVRAIPETALSAGLLTVVFAHWANQVASGNVDEVRQSFERIARWLTLLLAPALTALWLLRLEVVQLLFMGGKFGPEAAERTADVLQGFLPGFLPMMLAILVVKLLLVRGDVAPVVRAGIAGMCMNTALDALMVGPFGAPGLSLATSLNQIFVATLLFYALRARSGAAFEPGFWPWLLRRIAAALCGGGLTAGALRMLEPGYWGRWALVCGVMGALMGIEAWRAGIFRRGDEARS